MGKKGKRPKITARTFEESLDTFLSHKQLWRKPIAKDGSCLFRAVAEQVFICQEYHHKVRMDCAEYIKAHEDDFKEFMTVKMDEYLAHLTGGQLWGGEVELVALSKIYSRSIIVYNEQGNGVQEQVFACVKDEGVESADDITNPVMLAYSDGNHYDSVYSKIYRNAMALCQGIVYNLLYENVFRDRVSFSCCQRLSRLQESDMSKLDEVTPEDRPLVNLKKQFPTDVIVGMAPNLFRNVALDVHKREKEGIEQRDRHVAARIQFQIGDKCQVRLPEGQILEGEITSLDVTHGCHNVYVYACKEQWEIPYKDIRLTRNAGKRNSVPLHKSAAHHQGRLPQAQRHTQRSNSLDTSNTPSSRVVQKQQREEPNTPSSRVVQKQEPRRPSVKQSIPPPETEKTIPPPEITPPLPSTEGVHSKVSVASTQKKASKQRLEEHKNTPKQQQVEEITSKIGDAHSDVFPSGQSPAQVTMTTSPKPSPATTSLAKTTPGPHGSLTSDDSSYPSSSDESSNGHHTGGATNPHLEFTTHLHQFVPGSRERSTVSAPKVHGGSRENTTDVPAKPRGGSRENTMDAPAKPRGGSRENTMDGPAKPRGGSRENTMDAPAKPRGGSRENTTDGPAKSRGGSRENTMDAPAKPRGGSRENTTDGPAKPRGGSRENTTDGPAKSRGGSRENTTDGPAKPRGGSRENSTFASGKAREENSTVASGRSRGENSTFASGKARGENSTFASGKARGENSTFASGRSRGENYVVPPLRTSGRSRENNMDAPSKSRGGSSADALPKARRVSGENNTITSAKARGVKPLFPSGDPEQELEEELCEPSENSPEEYDEVDGKESPYIEPKLPKTNESSQPEDAWPILDVPTPGPEEQLGHSPEPSPNFCMPTISMFRPLDPAIARQIAPMIPSLMNPPPPISAESQTPLPSIKTASTESQTDAPPAMEGRETQTDAAGMEEIEPPDYQGENVASQFRFIMEYSLKCLKTYLYHNPSTEGHHKDTLTMMEKFHMEEAGKIETYLQQQHVSKAAKMKPEPLSFDQFIQSLASNTKPANSPPSEEKEKQMAEEHLTNPLQRVLKPVQQLSRPKQQNSPESTRAKTRPSTGKKEVHQPPSKVPPSPWSDTPDHLLIHPQDPRPRHHSEPEVKPQPLELAEKTLPPSTPEKKSRNSEGESTAENNTPPQSINMVPQQEHANMPSFPPQMAHMMMAPTMRGGLVMGTYPMPPMWYHPGAAHMVPMMPMPMVMPPHFPHMMQANPMMPNQVPGMVQEQRPPLPPEIEEREEEDASSEPPNDVVEEEEVVEDGGVVEEEKKAEGEPTDYHPSPTPEVEPPIDVTQAPSEVETPPVIPPEPVENSHDERMPASPPPPPPPIDMTVQSPPPPPPPPEEREPSPLEYKPPHKPRQHGKKKKHAPPEPPTNKDLRSKQQPVPGLPCRGTRSNLSEETQEHSLSGNVSHGGNSEMSSASKGATGGKQSRGHEKFSYQRDRARRRGGGTSGDKAGIVNDGDGIGGVNDMDGGRVSSGGGVSSGSGVSMGGSGGRVSSGGATVSMEGGSRAKVSMEGGSRAKAGMEGGGGAKVNVEGGGGAKVSMEGGSRAKVSMEGGSRAKAGMEGGGGAKVNVEGGGGAKVSMEGGGRAKVSMEGGSGAKAGMEGGGGAKVNVEAGGRVKAGMEGGGGAKVNVGGGGGAKVNVEAGGRVKAGMEGGGGAKVNVGGGGVVKAGMEGGGGAKIGGSGGVSGSKQVSDGGTGVKSGKGGSAAMKGGVASGGRVSGSKTGGSWKQASSQDGGQLQESSGPPHHGGGRSRSKKHPQGSNKQAPTRSSHNHDPFTDDNSIVGLGYSNAAYFQASYSSFPADHPPDSTYTDTQECSDWPDWSSVVCGAPQHKTKYTFMYDEETGPNTTTHAQCTSDSNFQTLQMGAPSHTTSTYHSTYKLW